MGSSGDYGELKHICLKAFKLRILWNPPWAKYSCPGTECSLGLPVCESSPGIRSPSSLAWLTRISVLLLALPWLEIHTTVQMFAVPPHVLVLSSIFWSSLECFSPTLHVAKSCSLLRTQCKQHLLQEVFFSLTPGSARWVMHLFLVPQRYVAFFHRYTHHMVL